MMDFAESESCAIDVAELLVVTVDRADQEIDSAVAEVVALLRKKIDVDIVFVRALRTQLCGQSAPWTAPGEADPLEAAWGEQLLSERLLPAELESGRHQCAPVVLADGSVYGTLCGFSSGEWTRQRDLKMLQAAAGLMAQKIDGPLWPDQAASMRRRSLFEYEATRPQ